MQGHKNMEIVKLQAKIDEVTKERDTLRSVIMQFENFIVGVVEKNEE